MLPFSEPWLHSAGLTGYTSAGYGTQRLLSTRRYGRWVLDVMFVEYWPTSSGVVLYLYIHQEYIASFFVVKHAIEA